MKTKAEVQEGQVVITFDVGDHYSMVIKLPPNNARNFKAQLEAALKLLERKGKKE